MIEIQFAESDTEIEQCRAVMSHLRPHILSIDFVARIRQQQLEGFRLLALRVDGEVECVCGFRIGHNLAWGKFLYIDDLVTNPSTRSCGHGGELFDWVVQFARQEGCDQLHLDSGVQRFGAHRFYLAKRMDISSHHFKLTLS